MPRPLRHSVRQVTGVESLQFAPDVTAPASARRFVVEVLTRWGCDRLVENAELVVSELVTNSVRHARTEGTLVISRHAGGVRIAATDSGHGTPGIQHPDAEEPSGRGLSIVAAVATRWGVEPRADEPGHTVWVELAEPQ